jgi:hypothetical protein
MVFVFEVKGTLIKSGIFNANPGLEMRGLNG